MVSLVSSAGVVRNCVVSSNDIIYRIGKGTYITYRRVNILRGGSLEEKIVVATLVPLAMVQSQGYYVKFTATCRGDV